MSLSYHSIHFFRGANARTHVREPACRFLSPFVPHGLSLSAKPASSHFTTLGWGLFLLTKKLVQSCCVGSRECHHTPSRTLSFGTQHLLHHGSNHTVLSAETKKNPKRPSNPNPPPPQQRTDKTPQTSPNSPGVQQPALHRTKPNTTSHEPKQQEEEKRGHVPRHLRPPLLRLRPLPVLAILRAVRGGAGVAAFSARVSGGDEGCVVCGDGEVVWGL